MEIIEDDKLIVAMTHSVRAKFKAITTLYDIVLEFDNDIYEQLDDDVLFKIMGGSKYISDCAFREWQKRGKHRAKRRS